MSDHCTHPSVNYERPYTSSAGFDTVRHPGVWRCVDCLAVVSIPGR